jgi:hypothetical protein
VLQGGEGIEAVDSAEYQDRGSEWTTQIVIRLAPLSIVLR